MATITIRQLIRAGACPEQRAKFRALFGASVEVTEELAIQHAKTFSWDWAADNLLPEDAREAYRQAVALAWEAYQRVMAAAREAFERATAAAREAYERATATAGEDYERATATAGEDYERATATAWAAYTPAMAGAFARLYIQHCDKGR